jgi:hypothetical protein
VFSKAVKNRTEELRLAHDRARAVSARRRPAGESLKQPVWFVLPAWGMMPKLAVFSLLPPLAPVGLASTGESWLRQAEAVMGWHPTDRLTRKKSGGRTTDSPNDDAVKRVTRAHSRFGGTRYQCRGGRIRGPSEGCKSTVGGSTPPGALPERRAMWPNQGARGRAMASLRPAGNRQGPEATSLPPAAWQCPGRERGAELAGVLSLATARKRARPASPACRCRGKVRIPARGHFIHRAGQYTGLSTCSFPLRHTTAGRLAFQKPPQGA